MSKRNWQLQEAKNKFSRLVEDAQKRGPQIVTKSGKKAVVVVSYDDYEKLTSPDEDLITYFQNCPLAEVNLDINRSKEIPRDIEL